MFEGIGAELIWDGTDEIRIPERMGKPREGQMEGTPAEQLTELAGRICYNSLGSKTSRSSADYIKHILDVGHLSIGEHYHITLFLESSNKNFLDIISFLMLNRPWVWVTPMSPNAVRITLNIRVAMEFNKWSKTLSEMIPNYPISEAAHLSAIISDCFHELAPRLIGQPHPAAVSMAVQQLEISASETVPPETDAEKWISLHVYGSRGLTHEAVRHGDFTAFSQRSTRYCNEGDSSWTLHPLIQQYLKEADSTSALIGGEGLKTFIGDARDLYKTWVKRLVPFIKAKLDPDDPYAKTTARKQARGAARGLLGNALETELVFSASVMEWRHIFRMRAAAAADGEIRVAACRALLACKASRYGDRFDDLELVEASDGTGHMLAGGGAA